MTDRITQALEALKEAVKAEPVEMIAKWRVLELISSAAPSAAEPVSEPECERCGMAPSAHDMMHWCDNQSFRMPDGSVQLGTAPPALQEASEPVADGEGWTVRVAGPDDIHHFRTELEALRYANSSNRTYLADRLAHPNDEVMCIAVVDPTADRPAQALRATASGDAEREVLTDERPRAPKAFREPEPGTPWWQTAKDCGAWTDRGEGDLGYVHFGSVEALRVFAGKIARQAEAALHSTGKPDVEGRLKKEARVGHTTFGIGVPERFVIEAAQRAAEHPQGLVDKEAAAGLQRIIQENAERAAFLDSHPAVSAELAALIEENERLLTLLAATADAPVAEPVAVVVSFGDLGGTVDWARNYRCPVGTKLYIRPPAPEEAKDAARRDLLQRCLKALEHFEKVRTRVLYGAAYAQHRRLINDVNAALSQGGGA